LPAAIGVALLLCLPTISIIWFYQSTNPQLLSPGDPVPVLTARDLASNEIHHFNFRDRPAAVLFFSADCPHCQHELTNFDRLSRRFGEQILFLAISMSGKKNTAELVNSDRLEVRTLLDEERTGQERFGVDVVPALFLIGTDQTIVYSSSGEKPFATREQLLIEFMNSVRPIHN
jgi:peroxiredoxin